MLDELTKAILKDFALKVWGNKTREEIQASIAYESYKGDKEYMKGFNSTIRPMLSEKIKTMYERFGRDKGKLTNWIKSEFGHLGKEERYKNAINDAYTNAITTDTK